jgi:hypothetical protein
VDLAETDKPAPMPNSVDLSVMPQGYKCRHDAAEGGWILTGPNGATLNFVPFPNLAAARCFAHDAAGWPQERRIAHEIAIQQQYVEERQTAAAMPAHPADGLTGTASGQPPPFRARLRLPMKAR